MSEASHAAGGASHRSAEAECDELRDLARQMLDAEEAYRQAPTLDNTSRLGRVRRRLEAVLAVGTQR